MSEENDRARLEAHGARWIKVADLAEVPPGTMICVESGSEPVAIYHLEDGTVCATDAICSHQFALLTDGILEDDLVECPLHAAQFNVRTGKPISEPAETDLKTYEVRLEGTDILVKL
jgi:3-phenylpropionate/trans-cinnamate dioxygenase ferredoxin subunit